MPPLDLNWTGVGLFAAGIALNWLQGKFAASKTPVPVAPAVVPAPVPVAVPAAPVPAAVHEAAQKPLLDLLHKFVDAALSKPIVPAVSSDPKVLAESVAQQLLANLIAAATPKAS